MAGRIGAMRETLTIQTPTPEIFAVTSVTRASALATVTTKKAHGFTTGDYVTVAGATPTGYNGRVKVTVTGTTTFTYTVASGLSTPASGTITATYAGDAQGGRNVVWRDLVTIRAERMGPARGAERLQAGAVTSVLDERFRARVRGDVTTAMRALWPPSWPPGASEQTLEIHSVLPDGDGRQYMVLECGVVG